MNEYDGKYVKLADDACYWAVDGGLRRRLTSPTEMYVVGLREVITVTPEMFESIPIMPAVRAGEDANPDAGRLKSIPDVNKDTLWDKHWEKTPSFWRRPSDDTIYDIIYNKLKQGSRILDVGGGLSRFSYLAKQRGHIPFVIDVSPYAIEELSTVQVGGCVFDIHKWAGETFGKFGFDVAVCTEVLEHLAYPEQAMRLIAFHVNRAFFSVPDCTEKRDDEFRHVREFSKESLAEFLKRYWKTVDIYPIGIQLFVEVSESRLMFSHLAPFRVVLVTGPQRTGTTICAKMIAMDAGHKMVREEEFNVHDVDFWRVLIGIGDRVVIQCPTMCRLVHEYGQKDNHAVVIMRRDLDDIIASQERIGWTEREEQKELMRYDLDTGPIAQVKYDFWEGYQKERIKNAFEVEFESLLNHPLWVPKVARVNFGARQTG